MDGLAALDEPSTVLKRDGFDARTTSRATVVCRRVVGGSKVSDHMWIIFRSKIHSRSVVAVALRMLGGIMRRERIQRSMWLQDLLRRIFVVAFTLAIEFWKMHL